MLVNISILIILTSVYIKPFYLDTRIIFILLILYTYFEYTPLYLSSKYICAILTFLYLPKNMLAIKKMKLANLPENRKKEFEREIAALMKLRPHQNLVNFMGVSVNENEICIIMEYCFGGSLFEWLHRKTEIPLNWSQKIHMATDIACGMNYLHTCEPPIIHRDLKSLK